MIWSRVSKKHRSIHSELFLTIGTNLIIHQVPQEQLPWQEQITIYKCLNIWPQQWAKVTIKPKLIQLKNSNKSSRNMTKVKIRRFLNTWKSMIWEGLLRNRALLWMMQRHQWEVVPQEWQWMEARVSKPCQGRFMYKYQTKRWPSKRPKPMAINTPDQSRTSKCHSLIITIISLVGTRAISFRMSQDRFTIDKPHPSQSTRRLKTSSCSRSVVKCNKDKH